MFNFSKIVKVPTQELYSIMASQAKGRNISLYTNKTLVLEFSQFLNGLQWVTIMSIFIVNFTLFPFEFTCQRLHRNAERQSRTRNA